ncbi:integral membrane sensor domain MASE1 [Herbihabitans rhizosphaerae]|uniref:Integral membrane sensor domain MASE1 n=1 Tax=Herbihabitans rhizosphaerae TaxID=1872711 RepID=A0A4Q7L9A4_9PSEU|nr:MASE1 domain-containing protein [Herbihabitans rhizosphaerae]RZS45012.1 integral membrane sensor domain MASE1 [Herbihabitans rhizosphaerae]
MSTGRVWDVVARCAAVAALYYGAAQIGLQLALVRGQVTPLWPSTGVALACLLLLGMRVWPGIAVGALLVNMPFGPSASALLVIVAGNTLAPVCARLLLDRARFRPELDRLRDALALVFLGALAGMAVSATIGTSTLVVAEAVPLREFVSTWSVWWTGDAMGVLVIVPLVLVIARQWRWPWRVSPLRWLEAGVLVAGICAVTLFATRTSFDLLFLVLPLLIWTAMRFQHAAAAPCALLVSVLAVVAAVERAGPFAEHGTLANMVVLQAFNGSVALTALLLSAITRERDDARRAIEEACVQLAEAVSVHQNGRALLHGSLLETVRRARHRQADPTG